MNYSVTNDKRLYLEYGLIIIGIILCVLLEIFVFNKIIIKNTAINVLWIVFRCAFSVSPFLFAYILKIIFKKFFFKILHIPNLTGKYDVKIISSYHQETISYATIEIEQTLYKIKIYFIAKNSRSSAINAQIDNSGKYSILSYMYHNDGKTSDKNNKSHIGSAVLTFQQGKISGFYYNNGNDRRTQGTIEAV